VQCRAQLRGHVPAVLECCQCGKRCGQPAAARRRRRAARRPKLSARATNPRSARDPPPPPQAARDKASYEDAFGPFYRVTQLILTTTPSAASPYVAPDGRPAVVTDANIKLLFDMQAEVDAITGAASGWAWGWGWGGVERKELQLAHGRRSQQPLPHPLLPPRAALTHPQRPTRRRPASPPT
jgi:hypothetical protein